MIILKLRTMKIIGLNQNIVWKDKQANFSLVEDKFKDLGKQICFASRNVQYRILYETRRVGRQTRRIYLG